MLQIEEILNFYNYYNSLTPDSKTGNTFLTNTIGIVVNSDDPLEQGRLQVFCPAYNDDPSKPNLLPWCIYISPYGGSIKNSSYTRGHDSSNCQSDGEMSYGFWGVPELGSQVLVGCLDGDIRRRYWSGSTPSHQSSHTAFGGRFKWIGNGPDGPLTSSLSKLQPIYNNYTSAFRDRESAEWKTRGALYQVSSNRSDETSAPNNDKGYSYVDDTFFDMEQKELDQWVIKALGDNGYDYTGFSNIGDMRTSKVYGMSSPNMHFFMMDDRPFNSRILTRTTAGSQILMDDTNERIYIMPASGACYAELDFNGNIDLYSDRRISLHSKKDMNFTSDETIRFHAKKSINMFAGEKESQESLSSPPEDGEIRLHSVSDTHIISEKNIRQLSVLDTLIEVGGKSCVSIGDSLYLQVENEINIITNTGDFNLTVSGNLNEFVQGNARKYALGTMMNMSNGNAQMHSFKGKMDVGAQKIINVKSIGEDIIMEAVGKNADKSGGVHIRSPESLYSVSNQGVSTLTTKKIKQKTPEAIEQEIADSDLTPNEETGATDPGDCSVGSTLSTDGYTGAALAARLAYNAGFRGKDLVTATAIAGAESGYNQSAVNEGDGRAVKWGPSVGMWQVRTLQNPSEWSGLDRNRDPNIVGGDNAQNNADFAYDVYQRSGFREWGAYTNGSYANHLTDAQNAVNSLCAGGVMGGGTEEEFNRIFIASSELSDFLCSSSILSSSGCNPDFSLSNNTLITMTVDGLNLQSKLDTAFKNAASNFSTKLGEGIQSKINEHAGKLNEVSANLMGFVTGVAGIGSGLEAIGTLVSTAESFLGAFDIPTWQDFLGVSLPFAFPLSPSDLLPNLNLDILLDDICKFKMPEFDIDINSTFQIEGFELCETQDDLTGELSSSITIR